MAEAMIGVPVEVDLGPIEGVELVDVDVTAPDGETVRVPAFRGADDHVRFRYAASTEGRHRYGVDGSDAAGEIELVLPWPNGLPGGFTSYYQYWIRDIAGPVNFSASNGLAGTTP